MGYYPQESLYKPYKYHGYTVRGTPNCALIIAMIDWIKSALKNFCDRLERFGDRGTA